MKKLKGKGLVLGEMVNEKIKSKVRLIKSGPRRLAKGSSPDF